MYIIVVVKLKKGPSIARIIELGDGLDIPEACQITILATSDSYDLALDASLLIQGFLDRPETYTLTNIMKYLQETYGDKLTYPD